MFDFVDQVATPALRARKKPLPPNLIRQKDHVPQEKSFIRFLEGQEAIAGFRLTTQGIYLDLAPRPGRCTRCRCGIHPAIYRSASGHTSRRVAGC